MPTKKRRETAEPVLASDEEPKIVDTYTLCIGNMSQAMFDDVINRLSTAAPTFQMWQSFVRDGAIMVKLCREQS